MSPLPWFSSKFFRPQRDRIGPLLTVHFLPQISKNTACEDAVSEAANIIGTAGQPRWNMQNEGFVEMLGR